jgi:hypothetical protein
MSRCIDNQGALPPDTPASRAFLPLTTQTKVPCPLEPAPELPPPGTHGQGVASAHQQERGPCTPIHDGGRILSLSVKGVGRANGRSVVVAAAYRSGERLADERTAEIFDYRARGGVIDKFILTKDGTAAWGQDRQQLWNGAERADDRANGRIANEIVLALPHELDAATRKQILKDYLAPLVEKHGVAIDVAIHEPGEGKDARNIHAHVLITHREFGADGFGEIANERTIQKKVKVKGHEQSQFRSRSIAGIAATPQDITALRKGWEQVVNRAYERAGLDIRVDHRSHEDRGLDQVPTIHIGPAAAEIEKREPGASDRAKINRDIAAHNAERKNVPALEAEVKALSAEVTDARAELAMRAAYAAARSQYDALRETHRLVARDQFSGRYDELTAATPPPEVVRVFDSNANRTTEPAAPVWDRDAENAAWEAKIADAAIGKDAEDARQQPAARAGSDMRAEAGGPSSGPQNRTEPHDTRPVGKTASEILMAWTLSRSAQQLEEALAARGIALAEVSPEEGEQSQRTAAFAKEVGNFAAALKAGEIVAVNEHGDVHRLSQRTTGDAAPDIEARFPGIDRAALLNVADTKDVLQDAARAAYRDEARQSRDMNTPLTGIETAIAAALANTMTGVEFAEALDAAGITIARATPADEKALGVLRHEAELAATVAFTENTGIDRDARGLSRVWGD